MAASGLPQSPPPSWPEPDFSGDSAPPSVETDRLWERQLELRQEIEETRESLDFFRRRRRIWDRWAGLIELSRAADRERFYKQLAGMSDAGKPDGGESAEEELARTEEWLDKWEKILSYNGEIREFIDQMPERFSQLNQDLDRLFQKEQLLEKCHQLLRGAP